MIARTRANVRPMLPFSRPLARLALACLVACTARVAAAQEPEPNPRPVRSTTQWGLELIAEGCQKSPSFRGLVDRLRQTRVIVYVQPSEQLPGVMVGATELLGVSGDFRYLRVTIGVHAIKKQLIALIGHELQHAAEIAGAAEIVDAGTLARFYRRVGDASVDGYDTAAARNMGDIVLDELWRWRASPTPARADAAEKPALPQRPLNAELTRR